MSNLVVQDRQKAMHALEYHSLGPTPVPMQGSVNEDGRCDGVCVFNSLLWPEQVVFVYCFLIIPVHNYCLILDKS